MTSIKTSDDANKLNNDKMLEEIRAQLSEAEKSKNNFKLRVHSMKEKHVKAFLTEFKNTLQDEAEEVVESLKKVESNLISMENSIMTNAGNRIQTAKTDAESKKRKIDETSTNHKKKVDDHAKRTIENITSSRDKYLSMIEKHKIKCQQKKDAMESQYHVIGLTKRIKKEVDDKMAYDFN